MSKTKHTPGPWIYGQTLNQGLAIWHSKIGEPDYVIAMHHGSGDKAYADVKLITAAPEMLEALKALIKSTPGCTDGRCSKNKCHCGFAMASKAVAKAEGRRG